MRKVLMLLMCLLLALPALAEPMSYLDYTDDILEDGSPIYYFPEISLQLPASWRGHVMAMAGEGGTSFYQTTSYEKYQDEGIDGGGFLFMLGVSVNGSFSELPAFRYLGYSEASSLNYYLMLPTDYPAYFQDDIRAEYDAMIADIDYVVAHATLYAATQATEPQTTEPQAAEPQTAEGAGITLERLRYHFEHSAMPRFFYEDPENMIDVLGDRGAFPLWQALADENGVAYPYTEGDFGQTLYTTDGGAEVLQVTLPAPGVTGQCYRIYFACDPADGSAGYYTIEYDDLLGETAFTCGWTKDMEHVNYGGAAILDPNDSGYGAALLDEARQVAALAGITGTLNGPDDVVTLDGDILVDIPCPELGFTTAADPAYSWDYQEGTGITIYTEAAGRIPYVIVWQSEDLIVEAYEYLQEQYTPHIQNQYGDDLVDYVEYETYDIGGKRLPAGLYTYRVQGHLVELLRLYDSTGRHTVAYTAKYLQGEGDATLAALDAAIRNFRAD